VPATGAKTGKPPGYLTALGLHLAKAASADYAPAPATESVLVYIGAGAKAISRQVPLTVSSAHGIRIDVSRHYRSQKQALAFQFLLDRLQAWNLIAWTRTQSTLAIVVGPEAAKVLGPASKLAVDAQRKP
jgi:hypothetical protein